MLGYSGGAVATESAAELASTYAPDVNARMIGAAMGGAPVDPAHNLYHRAHDTPGGIERTLEPPVAGRIQPA